jgi:hypothetical protein
MALGEITQHQARSSEKNRAAENRAANKKAPIRLLEPGLLRLSATNP